MVLSPRIASGYVNSLSRDVLYPFGRQKQAHSAKKSSFGQDLQDLRGFRRRISKLLHHEGTKIHEVLVRTDYHLSSWFKLIPC